MAEPTPLKKTTNAVRTTLGLPIALTRYVANEPFITGPLLWALTRGPADLRERLLSPIRSNTPDRLKNYLGPTSDVRLAKIISILKVLFALGAVKRVNNALNALALNGWYLPGMKPMAKWRWDGKTEVVVITGGCSGFGYEMVKGFAGKAKIVVIDISELPSELEKCEYRRYSTSGDSGRRVGVVGGKTLPEVAFTHEQTAWATNVLQEARSKS